MPASEVLVPEYHHKKPFSKLTKVYIDFEYNQSKSMYMNLVACSMLVEGEGMRTWWLDQDESARAELKAKLKSMRETHLFFAFNVVAEASSFISLKLNPAKFAWVDLQLEYKMLINHNHKYMYGDQLIKGKRRRTKAPKIFYNRTEEEDKKADSSKPEKSLVAAVFKMLGKDLNLKHKDEMRDLIISEPDTWSEEQKKAVLLYCDSDVEILPPLFRAIANAFKTSDASVKYHEAAWRGQSAARTALMMQTGYPVNPTRVSNFSKSVSSILNDLCKDINEQFPEAGFFSYNKRTDHYTMKQKPLRDFIDTTDYADKWKKTDGGTKGTPQHSLALDAWTRHFSYSHDYPRGNVAAQIIRFLKTKQNLNGFLPAPKKGTGKDRKTFFDSYGPDDRARAWLNPYGSQSSRFQPAATGFIPLKSAWMRSLIEPKEGFSICGIDYGSEEFLLAALLSKDEKMYQSYASGDPYLHFAKLAGAVPEDGTKEEYPLERLRFKSTVLGIGYLMAKFSLASKLTLDTGERHSPEDAEKLINLYFEVYRGYKSWIEGVQHEYIRKNHLKLLDGWVMYGDNPNIRSVSNCPVQGAGACILRKAIQLAQDRGLRVIIPLHDALYIEYPDHKVGDPDILAECMKEAFGHYFKGDKITHEWSQAIRLDLDIWGPSHEDTYIATPGGLKAKTQKIYIDPRAKTEYERFSAYF